MTKFDIDKILIVLGLLIVPIKHKIIRFLSKTTKSSKRIEMQTVFTICTPTIDIEPERQ